MSFTTGTATGGYLTSWNSLYNTSTATTTTATLSATAQMLYEDSFENPRKRQELTDSELEHLVRQRGGIASFPKTRMLHPGFDPFAPPDEHDLYDQRTVRSERDCYELPKMNAKILLPDGSLLHLDRHGNYSIEDDHAKVVYKANRVREFNPYINASDLLEQFIKFLATVGVLQKEVLEVPINVFIHWLVYKAAERDGDEVKDTPKPVDVLPQRFITAPA